jgi:chromosome segregation protein
VRLCQIKLAGFKSFVDPTQIDVPGSLVGVVGPNGCGKSNVIDAVRWVLGESKATELRGESMQDVIFNGSSNRKPGGRASVELSFDNHEGRIGGEWAKFSEIAVKRVLTRDGASSYYINNQHVRRRDVQDMFLGTGLGPRAYAIIGQGMISRIIEARPEELRVFLEEAAGVSKYKERRRETENRLADTRDNLTRVEDILRELDAQIAKLEQQAEVAQHYKTLQASHDEKQRLLWLIRKRDAAAEQEKLARDIATRQTALEAHIAELRSVQRRVEELRAAHYAQSDGVHEAQSQVLTVNAEIGKLEAEVRRIVDSRTALAAQIESTRAARERRLAERGDLEARAAHLQQQLDDGAQRLDAAGNRVTEQQSSLPGFETAYASAREALSSAREQAATAEQAIDAAATEQRALERESQNLEQRRQRLIEELGQLGAPDEPRLAALQAETQRLQAELEAAQQRLASAESRIAPLQAERQQLLEARTKATDTLAHLEARLHAAQDLQAKVEADERLDPWLRTQGLESLPRLFRKLHVEPGWEAAFEAVLRERVEALEVGRLDSLAGLAGNAPPARVAFYSPTAAAGPEHIGPSAGFPRLAERVRGHDASLAGVLGDWLANVYVAEDLGQALGARAQLPLGGQFVVRSGHLVSRHAVRFFAADDRKAGLLARRQEIENLERELRAQQLIASQASDDLTRCEAALRGAQEQVQTDRQAGDSLRQRAHSAQLESVRLGELIDRVKHRAGQIAAELAEADTQAGEVAAQREAVDRRFEESDREVAQRQEAVESARVAYEDADRALRAAREELQQRQADANRVQFELQAARERAGDISHAIGSAAEDAERLGAELERLAAQLAGLDDSVARNGLERWLGERSSAEDKLREARSRLDDLQQQLRATDEQRMQLEQGELPLRERITELQLKEQAARLNGEQHAQQLAESGADEPALVALLESQPVKANALQAEITRLAGEITALGAVNLAALEELTTSRERKTFLDAQSADLTAAITTLEDAIRKIDRETREQLFKTFDEVNGHFGQLFPKLFGGGEARLTMTGEEILDAGVQVMAQPPGKRNSTIHLLSGGEKALTATALVFAMFKLNPAPFCLLDEVDAPLDDANTDRFCNLVRSMTGNTQFLFITHNKIAMEMAEQLIGVTMQEQGVSRIVAVDIDSAVQLTAEAA